MQTASHAQVFIYKIRLYGNVHGHDMLFNL